MVRCKLLQTICDCWLHTFPPLGRAVSAWCITIWLAAPYLTASLQHLPAAFFLSCFLSVFLSVFLSERCKALYQPPPAVPQVWIMAGTGVLAVAGELSWAVGQWRAEQRVQRVQAVLTAAGTETGLEEALLRGGTQAVHEYLEP